jgi:hypothetical protein
MTEDAMIKLEDTCRTVKVPLLGIRSYGLLGYLRVGGA